jgi:NADH-dependent peroxiredoxin subunit C
MNNCESGCNCSCHVTPPKVGEKVGDFSFDIYHKGEDSKTALSNYKGKWVVLFFYPADFTFVCPTELEDMANHYAKFKEAGAEVISVSTDTVFVHKAWHDASESIKKIEFPMAADTDHALSKGFGVLRSSGLSDRGSFIIDPEGVLQAMEVTAEGVGRNAGELLRKLQAAKFVHEHGDKVCPANWKPGGDTLEPGMDLVGKL